MREPQSRQIRVAGTELAVREWGDPDGHPLLFWHALGDHNSLQLIEAGPVLAEDYGLRCIGVDAPGFGGSERVADAGYEVPPLMNLADGLLDELGVERFVWLGSSWGASLGVHYAATRPDRVAALVLLDGGYLDPSIGGDMTLDELKEHWRDQGNLFRFESWDAMVEDAKQYFRRWTPEIERLNRASYREEDGQVVSIMGPDVYAAAIYGLRISPPSTAHDLLGQTEVPVLVLAATLPAEQEEARAGALERFLEHVPHADIRRMEDSPHFLLEDKPEETARIVGGWLEALGYLSPTPESRSTTNLR